MSSSDVGKCSAAGLQLRVQCDALYWQNADDGGAELLLVRLRRLAAGVGLD